MMYKMDELGLRSTRGRLVLCRRARGQHGGKGVFSKRDAPEECSTLTKDVWGEL